MKASKEQTFKEYLGKRSVTALQKRLSEVLDADGGFVIIGNLRTGRMSDAYYNICADHVLEGVQSIVGEAMKDGILEERCD